MSVWRRSLDERGMDVLLDFLGLTGMTFLTPMADVAFHTVPNKTRGDSSLSRLVSRMEESVDGVEDTFCPGRWTDRSVLSCGNVTEDGEVFEWNIRKAVPDDVR